MSRAVYASSESDEWGTPPWLFDWCSEHWGDFDLDAAASDSSCLHPNYYTAETDGLLQPWTGRVWCNPPYSKAGEFAQRAAGHAQEGGHALLLLPARTDTHWFHDWVFGRAAHLVFLRGRIPFVDPKTGKERAGATFPSCLAWYAWRPWKGLCGFDTFAVAEIKTGAAPRWDTSPRQLSIMEES